MNRTITCPRCHSAMLLRARFCRHCGTALKAAAAERIAESWSPPRRFQYPSWITWRMLLSGVSVGVVVLAVILPRAAVHRKPLTKLNLDPAVQNANALVGAWLETRPSAVGKFAARRLELWCNADQSFREQCDVFQGAENAGAAERISFSGTWQLKGGILVCVVSEATRYDFAPKGAWRYAVLSLDDHELVLRLDDAPIALPESEGDRIVYFRRLK